MAEFAEVMKQAKRMYKEVDRCKNCPSPVSLCTLCHTTRHFAEEDIESAMADYEKAVMDWAASHPQPKYPTWCRWLVMMGAITSGYDLWMDLQQPIPADIAEKLGIPPKDERR